MCPRRNLRSRAYQLAQEPESEVTIARSGETLRIEVADDGRGGADPAKGSGLRGLQDRVAVLGGTFELAGPPGTTLRAELPLAALA